MGKMGAVNRRSPVLYHAHAVAHGMTMHMGTEKPWAMGMVNGTAIHR